MTLSHNRTRVIIETTSTLNGALEQGGVCGRRVSYNAAEVAALIGIGVDDIEVYDEDDEAPGREVTIKELIEASLDGHVVRTGAIIQ